MVVQTPRMHWANCPGCYSKQPVRGTTARSTVNIGQSCSCPCRSQTTCFCSQLLGLKYKGVRSELQCIYKLGHVMRDGNSK